MLGPSAGPSYTPQRWREHGPRFGGNCPTRVVAAYVSKKTTLHMLSMYLCLSVYEYVLSTVFDDLILAAYSLGRRISKIVAAKLRLHESRCVTRAMDKDSKSHIWLELGNETTFVHETCVCL